MIKHPKKKVGLLFAAMLALGLVVPTAAQAEVAGPSTVTTTSDAPEVSSQIAKDPDARYVSVAEANEQFGYEPIENTDSIEPVFSPYTSWWGCDYEGRADYPHVNNNQASVHGYWVSTVGWRGQVDVDLADFADPPGTTTVSPWT